MTDPHLPAPPSPWQGLRQRFDAVALRPPAMPADGAALARRGATTRAALLAWCGQGAGPGGAPFWQPGALPRVDQRLAIGALCLAQDGPARHGPAETPARQAQDAALPSAWVDQVACELDGSLRLAALPGRAAALAFRLAVKRRDAMWWRPRLADDPWDAGWALTTPAALQQLQAAFQPRRATLVLADAASRALLQPGLAALSQRQAGLRHPVRWLWVGDDHDLRALPALPGLSITRFAAA